MPRRAHISFEQKDSLFPHQVYLRKIVSSAVWVLDKSFLEEYFDFIVYFTDTERLKREFVTWKDKRKKLLFDKTKVEALEEMLQGLYDTFLSVKDEDMGKFRGLVFEKVMEIHFLEKYSARYTHANKFGTGCQILIDGYVIKRPSGEPPSTVDIAGYNPNECEFYELKVAPDNFDNCVIEFLRHLYNKSVRNEISKMICVGCMILRPKVALEIHLEEQEICYDELKLFGKREVIHILS